MPTLVIRVVLVQLFGLVGQSGKVDGSFAPTRASSTADSQLAIHPSHLRVYSQIKTQAGLLAKAVCQYRMCCLTRRLREQVEASNRRSHRGASCCS